MNNWELEIIENTEKIFNDTVRNFFCQKYNEIDIIRLDLLLILLSKHPHQIQIRMVLEKIYHRTGIIFGDWKKTYKL